MINSDTCKSQQAIYIRLQLYVLTVCHSALMLYRNESVEIHITTDRLLFCANLVIRKEESEDSKVISTEGKEVKDLTQ